MDDFLKSTHAHLSNFPTSSRKGIAGQTFKTAENQIPSSSLFSCARWLKNRARVCGDQMKRFASAACSTSSYKCARTRNLSFGIFSANPFPCAIHHSACACSRRFFSHVSLGHSSMLLAPKRKGRGAVSATATPRARGSEPSVPLLPFSPMLLTQFGTLADAVERYTAETAGASSSKKRGAVRLTREASQTAAAAVTSQQPSPSPSSSSSPPPPLLPPHLQPPYFVSPKHDGIRCITWKDRNKAAEMKNKSSSRGCDGGGKGRAAPASPPLRGGLVPPSAFSPSTSPSTCHTRFGTQLPTLSLLEEELAVLRALAGDEGLTLDGELYLHDDQALPLSATDDRPSSSPSPSGGEASAAGGEESITFAHGSGYRRLKEALGKLQHGLDDAAAVRSFFASPAAVSSGASDGAKQRFFSPLPLSAAARGGGGGGKKASSGVVAPPFPYYPRLCVFDVVSYVPPAVPTCPLMAHVMVLTGVGRLSALACSPSETPFLMRARTLIFLFTLLQAYIALTSTSSSSLSGGKAKGLASSSSSSSTPSVSMAFPAPAIEAILKEHAFGAAAAAGGGGGGGGGGGDDAGSAEGGRGGVAAPQRLLHPLRYRGGHFVKLVPYAVCPALEEAPSLWLPRYLAARYEGAVVRTAMNTYAARGWGHSAAASGTNASSSSSTALSLPGASTSSAAAAAQRSPTAVKLLPYFDKEYMVLRYTSSSDDDERGGSSSSSPFSSAPSAEEGPMLASVVCCTERGTPFTVDATGLCDAERRALYSALSGDEGSDVGRRGGRKGTQTEAAAAAATAEGCAIGAFVTLQYALLRAVSGRGLRGREMVPVGAVIKGVRGRDKGTFM